MMGKGKWLTRKLVDPYRREYQEVEVKVDSDGCTMEECYCSECGKYLVGSDEYKCYGNFCPYCGAKMIELQESENKV